jgi:hypothetical protein
VGGLERQAGATSEFVSEEELNARIETALGLRARRESGKVFQFGHRFQPNYNDIFGVDKGMHSSGVMLNTRAKLRRRWAIVDPPDGVLPALTPEAIKLYEAREANTAGRGDADSWEDRSMGERCIVGLDVATMGNNGLGGGGGEDVDSATAKKDPTFSPTGEGGGGGGFAPTGRILQGPGYFAIVEEQGNEGEAIYRMIPVTPQPALGPKVRQWKGDSRGHWEGNTLVVETSNIWYGSPMGARVFSYYGASAYPGTGETLRITERFTRLDADTIEYRATIDDPKTYARPYTKVSEMTLDNGYQPLPGLCHENNRDMGAILSNARVDEAASLEFGEEARLQRAQRAKARFTELAARAQGKSR